MSQREKLLRKLFSKPADFTWNELKTLLEGLGYQELKGHGSRRKFYNKNLDSMIVLHKPHPGNTLKGYAIDEVIEQLGKRGIRP